MRHSLLATAALALCDELDPLRFAAPVTHVYNPLRYAWEGHDAYLKLVSEGAIRAVFVGMNPGPYGMAQTGVPFGEVAAVRDFLRLAPAVGQPEVVHPRRPIQGMACTRAEVSGSRLWGAIERHFGSPERFFAHYFIVNYCPLVFMEESGRNRTPDKLSAAERAALFAACDRHLRRAIEILAPEWVVGIGVFAESRARLALEGKPLQIGRILHPSPASPATNQGWEPAVTRDLTALGLCPLLPDTPSPVRAGC